MTGSIWNRRIKGSPPFFGVRKIMTPDEQEGFIESHEHPEEYEPMAQPTTPPTCPKCQSPRLCVTLGYSSFECGTSQCVNQPEVIRQRDPCRLNVANQQIAKLEGELAGAVKRFEWQQSQVQLAHAEFHDWSNSRPASVETMHGGN